MLIILPLQPEKSNLHRVVSVACSTVPILRGDIVSYLIMHRVTNIIIPDPNSAHCKNARDALENLNIVKKLTGKHAAHNIII